MKKYIMFIGLLIVIKTNGQKIEMLKVDGKINYTEGVTLDSTFSQPKANSSLSKLYPVLVLPSLVNDTIKIKMAIFPKGEGNIIIKNGYRVGNQFQAYFYDVRFNMVDSQEIIYFKISTWHRK